MREILAHTNRIIPNQMQRTCQKHMAVGFRSFASQAWRCLVVVSAQSFRSLSFAVSAHCLARCIHCVLHQGQKSAQGPAFANSGCEHKLWLSVMYPPKISKLLWLGGTWLGGSGWPLAWLCFLAAPGLAVLLIATADGSRLLVDLYEHMLFYTCLLYKLKSSISNFLQQCILFLWCSFKDF